MIEEIQKLMSIIEMQTASMNNIFFTLKIAGERITQLEKEIDDLKVIVNANQIVKNG